MLKADVVNIVTRRNLAEAEARYPDAAKEVRACGMIAKHARWRSFVEVRQVFAAFLMLAWDLAMDPAWGTIDRAWIWRDGGAFYGVPISNFFGWYLTAYVFFQAFALHRAANSSPPAALSRNLWRGPILLYVFCAAGNPLLLRLRGIPPAVVDATGRQSVTRDILATSAMVSLLVMLPMALLAWLRLEEADRP